MFICWRELEGYHKFLEGKWRSFDVQGWGGYILKEKIKMIKRNLRDLSESHMEKMDGKIEEVKKKVNEMDIKSEVSMLTHEDVLTKMEASVQL